MSLCCPLPETRHYLSVPKALFASLAELSPQARDRFLDQALARVQGRTPVLVCDANRRLLKPCHPARARELLRRKRARVLSTDPFLLQLKRVVAPELAQ
ncbi:hypothetical protein G3480_23510 [Thiorhodococcus mannitoliphagus]|uniref:RRXRR domain-containing protein n=1 Tax=Thiorhodococcus mannitoliphagus TaxID=329406 RepID=A0A6P1DZV6_9GAMM|nr:RRXRR domain-containing protein [Thiorhodococcus mannitoliphagus]NEX23229.1 hypothetical protein [Thiorhodococcus mannitoliphagus]